MFKKMIDRANMSLAQTKKVRGYEIKKMPIGAYLIALEKLKNLPMDFMETCFQGKDLQQTLDVLTDINEEKLVTLFTSLFVSAPKYAVRIVSELTEIPENDLLNDENIGLDGFVEIVSAFVEVNRLGEFLLQVGELKTKISKLTTRTK